MRRDIAFLDFHATKPGPVAIPGPHLMRAKIVAVRLVVQHDTGGLMPREQRPDRIEHCVEVGRYCQLAISFSRLARTASKNCSVVIQA